MNRILHLKTNVQISQREDGKMKKDNEDED